MLHLTAIILLKLSICISSDKVIDELGVLYSVNSSCAPVIPFTCILLWTIIIVVVVVVEVLDVIIIALQDCNFMQEINYLKISNQQNYFKSLRYWKIIFDQYINKNVCGVHCRSEYYPCTRGSKIHTINRVFNINSCVCAINLIGLRLTYVCISNG